MTTGATQLAVFYAAGSKILRRKIISDSDAQLALHQPGPGESRLLMPLDRPYGDKECSEATGVAPPPGRCCVVDAAGKMTGVCNADPALDTHPTGSLVASDIAGPGDSLVAGRFVRPYAVVSTATNTVTAIRQLSVGARMTPLGCYLATAGSHRVSDLLPPHGKPGQEPA
jgi:hypothetical protein